MARRKPVPHAIAQATMDEIHDLVLALAIAKRPQGGAEEIAILREFAKRGGRYERHAYDRYLVAGEIRTLADIQRLTKTQRPT